jgi:molybdopterin converting factor small subunit
MLCVTLRYHAFLRETLNRDSDRVELALSPATVADALAAFVQKYPVCARLAPSLHVARDEEFLPRDEPLRDGDVLEILPPYGGG